MGAVGVNGGQIAEDLDPMSVGIENVHRLVLAPASVPPGLHERMQDRSTHNLRPLLMNPVQHIQPVISAVAFECRVMEVGRAVEIVLGKRFAAIGLGRVMDQNDLVMDVPESHEGQFQWDLRHFMRGMSLGDLEAKHVPVPIYGTVGVAYLDREMLHSPGLGSGHGYGPSMGGDVQAPHFPEAKPGRHLNGGGQLQIGKSGEKSLECDRRLKTGEGVARADMNAQSEA